MYMFMCITLQLKFTMSISVTNENFANRYKWCRQILRGVSATYSRVLQTKWPISIPLASNDAYIDVYVRKRSYPTNYCAFFINFWLLFPHKRFRCYFCHFFVFSFSSLVFVYFVLCLHALSSSFKISFM